MDFAAVPRTPLSVATTIAESREEGEWPRLLPGPNSIPYGYRFYFVDFAVVCARRISAESSLISVRSRCISLHPYQSA